MGYRDLDLATVKFLFFAAFFLVLQSGCDVTRETAAETRPESGVAPVAVSGLATPVSIAATSVPEDSRPFRQDPVTQPAADPAAERDSESGLLDRAQDLLNHAAQGGSAGAQSAGRWVQDRLSSAADSTGAAAQDTLNWADETFEMLKSQGMTTATTTADWLKEDWNNMESWEYKLVTIDTTNDQPLEEQLNDLGRQGWECFDVTANRWVFKRRRQSYLRRLPFRDLLLLAPLATPNSDK